MLYKICLADVINNIYNQIKYLQCISSYDNVTYYIQQLNDVAKKLCSLNKSFKLEEMKNNIINIIPKRGCNNPELILMSVKSSILTDAKILSDLRDKLAPEDDLEVIDNCISKLNELYNLMGGGVI